jgi:hypothetical protein
VLFCVRLEKLDTTTMVVVYAGSFPPDPKADAENFQRKQAEYEAAYRHTGEPRMLYEALLNARAYLRFPPELDWLMEALGHTLRKGRTDQTAERFREHMRHVQRYRSVRHLRKEGHGYTRALDLAVVKLETTDDPAARPTIEASYNKVKRDLEEAGHKGKYFLLVARSDPTVVPVIIAQTPQGMTLNGVLQSPGMIVKSDDQGGDS